MKDINQNNRIEEVLSSFKSNESVSLSYFEKQNILNSVFERVETGKVTKAIRSPLYNYQNYFVQYLKYSIPVLFLVVFGTQMANVFNNRSRIAISDLNDVKSTLESIKMENAIKSNLSKNKEDIQELKLSLSSNTDSVKTQVLATKVSTRSKEIRNQVAALRSENKITEAKKVALDLESALKADELYKVSTSVEQEVFEAIDLRVDIEKEEYRTISSSTESDVLTRIESAKKEVRTFEKTASTTDMIISAEASIEVAEEYAVNKDLENAIISLQLYDRIVAELEIILLP